MIGSSLKAGAVLVSTFLVGLLAGVYWERLHGGGASGGAGDGAAAMMQASGAALHQAAMESLEDSLHLDDAQKAHVHEVFLKHQGLIQQSWEAMRPSLSRAIEEIHREVGEVLTEEQREAFHSWLSAHGGEHHHPRHLLH